MEALNSCANYLAHVLEIHAQQQEKPPWEDCTLQSSHWPLQLAKVYMYQQRRGAAPQKMHKYFLKY